MLCHFFYHLRLTVIFPRHGNHNVTKSAWRRAAKSDHDDDSGTESPAPDARRESKMSDQSHVQLNKGQGLADSQGQSRQKKMSFKAAGQATLTFLTARKRIEDGLKSWSKRRPSKRGSIDDGDSCGEYFNYIKAHILTQSHKITSFF
jgi:hypothetical protein